MSLLVKITNISDSFAIGTTRVERQETCPHCGHCNEPRSSQDANILPRDSTERIIRCGDKLILEALSDNGIPPATW